jgi:hypothetical protein
VCGELFKVEAKPVEVVVMKPTAATFVVAGRLLVRHATCGRAVLLHRKTTGYVGVEDDDNGEVRWYSLSEGGTTLVRVEDGARLARAWDESEFDVREGEPSDAPQDPNAS